MSYPTIEDYPFITIEIDGKAVTLTRFVSYTREPLHGASIDYAFSGNETVQRTPHEKKYMWMVTVLATWKERREFEYITELADRKIYKPPFNAYQLTLSDVYLSVVESSVSRVKADSYQDVGEIGDIEYFAKFSVAIGLNSIKLTPAGEYVELSFVMNELGKLTA